jgi:hypothetical protein
VALTHRSARKECSANFAPTAFSEVRRLLTSARIVGSATLPLTRLVHERDFVQVWLELHGDPPNLMCTTASGCLSIASKSSRLRH